MALELLFNGGLFIFLIYCFIYIGRVEADINPGILDAVEWPRILLGILIVLIALNMINIFRKRKEGETFKIEFNIKGIFKSKLLIAVVFLLVYAYSLDYIGFIPASLLLFLSYSRLLGQKSIKVLVASSIISIAVLYIIFNSMLGIMLPRGMGMFRSFALFLERLI